MDKEIISNIRSLGIDMINNVKSGHPGIALGAAPIIYTLYAKHMNININDINWLNRDRFIMSAGHGSALLYATLYMAGFNLTIDDLKDFRKGGSKTPGHPEYRVTPGVDMTTGPLGQGFATAVGMALASKKLQKELTYPTHNKFEKECSLINHNIYVLCSDGDIMEGVSSEAASIAGTLELDNLIVLYDSNDITLSGNCSLTFKENVLEKFKAMGWNTEYVKNGEDIKAIDKAIENAKHSNKPTIIEIKTVIGKGSILEGTNEIHGKVLSDEDYNQLKQKLNMPKNPFYVSEEARRNFIDQITKRSSKKYDEWSKNYKDFNAGLITNKIDDYNFLFNKDAYINILDHEFNLNIDKKEATRFINQKIMIEIARMLPNFIGGSADLAKSTGTYLEHFGDINKKDNYNGRNIWFGVREHAMGSILNGLAMYNYKVFGSTFLSFSDYMKPAIRMTCLLNLPVIYIFSHDSIYIGHDGPTHQPVEQLAMLRSTPNLNVYRPSDAKELIGCWHCMLNLNKPNALILSRHEVEQIPFSKSNLVIKGAYILKQEIKNIDAIIIASGTEVQTALYIARDLYQSYKLDLRVVSMPCMELFLKESEEYQEMVLPKGFKKIVIEAGCSYGLNRFVYNDNYLFTVNNYGISGSKEEVLKYENFDYETIKDGILKLLR